MTENPTTTEGPDQPRRVVFLPHNPYDAPAARAVFAEYRIPVVTTDRLSALIEEAKRGAGCLFVAEEKLKEPDFESLLEVLDEQPEWSDLPVVVATHPHRSSDRAWHLAGIANTTLVERPIRIQILVSVVRSALRDRRRQYEIRQSIANRDRFLAMVGHEIRNPLTSISLAVQQLQHQIDSPALDIVDRQSDNLERIVDDLRNISRISRGELEFNKQHIDIVDIARESVRAFADIADDQDLDLDTDLVNTPLWTYGDPERLAQVLSNLLGNAVRYTPEGGRIEVRTGREENDVVVSICDTGKGIPEDELDDIFAPFTRGTNGGDEEGLGLGLNLAHSIVDQHDGRLVAESEGEGKGSRFTVRLPVSRPPDESTDRDSPPAAR